jgi:putative transposase
LTAGQRQKLLRITRTGKRSAREILRAHVLLKSADGWSDEQIVEAYNTSDDTIRRTRKRYIEAGMIAALGEQPRTGQPVKLSQEEETLLIALACSKPPAGRQRWTVRLLAEQAIEQKLIKEVVPETVRAALQKTR